MKRNRFRYFVCLLIVVLLGLASRHFKTVLPIWVGLYLGDALWALMVFFLLGFVFARKTTGWVAATALIFSFCIEISQLYHAPWIDHIRATLFGGLILGYGFLWSDLVCYCMGIFAGVMFELLFPKLR